jgi:hypothetical protein
MKGQQALREKQGEEQGVLAFTLIRLQTMSMA